MITEHDLETFGYFEMIDAANKPESNYDKVYEFMETFQPYSIASPWDETGWELRMSLMKEELKEVEQAWNEEVAEGYEEAVVKELVDLLYVTYGTLVFLGVDADEAFRRVHESNMSKVGDDGRPVYRADGKVLKGPNYKAPDLSDLV